jgi:hypothetical protein
MLGDGDELTRVTEACFALSRVYNDEALKQSGYNALLSAVEALDNARERCASVLVQLPKPPGFNRSHAPRFNPGTVQAAVDEAIAEGDFPYVLQEILVIQVDAVQHHVTGYHHLLALQMLGSLLHSICDGALDHVEDYDPADFLNMWSNRALAAITGGVVVANEIAANGIAAKEALMEAVAELAGGVAACEEYNKTHPGLMRVQSRCVRLIEGDGEDDEWDEDEEEDEEEGQQGRGQESEEEEEESENDNAEEDFIVVGGGGPVIVEVDLTAMTDEYEEEASGEEASGEEAEEAEEVEEKEEEEEEEGEAEETVEGHVAKRART